ncbi:MAG: hypothetical protein M9898_08940 [Chitinophagaceae bacterium]|nr:hypothetical protein [Chitinophagaceae bacterium]
MDIYKSNNHNKSKGIILFLSDNNKAKAPMPPLMAESKIQTYTWKAGASRIMQVQE